MSATSFKRIGARRTRGCALAAASAVLLAGFVLTASSPERAIADASFWGCQAGSGAVCFESPNLRGWVYVKGSLPSYNVKYEVCAKGVTSSGNQRGGGGCSYYVNTRISCFGAAEPASRAYVYWGGSGGAETINGAARTPSSNEYPCT